MMIRVMGSSVEALGLRVLERPCRELMREAELHELFPDLAHFCREVIKAVMIAPADFAIFESPFSSLALKYIYTFFGDIYRYTYIFFCISVPLHPLGLQTSTSSSNTVPANMFSSTSTSASTFSSVHIIICRDL